MNNCIESFSRNGILFIYIYSRQMHGRKKKNIAYYEVTRAILSDRNALILCKITIMRVTTDRIILIFNDLIQFYSTLYLIITINYIYLWHLLAHKLIHNHSPCSTAPSSLLNSSPPTTILDSLVIDRSFLPSSIPSTFRLVAHSVEFSPWLQPIGLDTVSRSLRWRTVQQHAANTAHNVNGTTRIVRWGMFDADWTAERMTIFIETRHN